MPEISREMDRRHRATTDLALDPVSLAQTVPWLGGTRWGGLWRPHALQERGMLGSRRHAELGLRALRIGLRLSQRARGVAGIGERLGEPERGALAQWIERRESPPPGDRLGTVTLGARIFRESMQRLRISTRQTLTLALDPLLESFVCQVEPVEERAAGTARPLHSDRRDAVRSRTPEHHSRRHSNRGGRGRFR